MHADSLVSIVRLFLFGKKKAISAQRLREVINKKPHRSRLTEGGFPELVEISKRQLVLFLPDLETRISSPPTGVRITS